MWRLTFVRGFVDVLRVFGALGRRWCLAHDQSVLGRLGRFICVNDMQSHLTQCLECVVENS